jgi:hypothetical protein
MDASRDLTVEDAPNGARGLKCAYVNSVIVPIIWILALSTLYIQLIKRCARVHTLLYSAYLTTRECSNLAIKDKMRFHLDLYIISITIDFLPGLFPLADIIYTDLPEHTVQADSQVSSNT